MHLTPLLCNSLQLASNAFKTPPTYPTCPETTSSLSSDMAATASPYLDVLIIGGGPAGLAVATGLARQLYTALVFDSGVYRNDATKHMHNFPGWDHRDPADFRKTAREDILRRYSTIQFRNTSVNSVAKTSNGLFRVTDAQGKEWLGRKLALAMGVRDVYPDIDGYGDCWGRGMYAFSSPWPA